MGETFNLKITFKRLKIPTIMITIRLKIIHLKEKEKMMP
jgi:hypothetical protein